MKFEKFVKQLGGAGVIQTRDDGSKWLASFSALLRIPDDMNGVIAESITVMPPNIDKVIRKELSGAEAALIKAIMPTGDAAIKDCIRVYATSDGQKVPICNDDYSLIDPKHDVVEVLSEYDLDTEKLRPTALLVKEYVNLEDTRLIGVIFPVADAVDNI